MGQPEHRPRRIIPQGQNWVYAADLSGDFACRPGALQRPSKGCGAERFEGVIGGSPVPPLPSWASCRAVPGRFGGGFSNGSPGLDPSPHHHHHADHHPPSIWCRCFRSFRLYSAPWHSAAPQALSELQERNRHRPLQAAFNSPSISSNGKLDDGR